MDPLVHAPDVLHLEHLKEAQRVLALPIEVNNLAWHPFGVYGVPLSRRHDDGKTWSRRLHVWHPEADPVGETSIYGVHTHSGTAHSHVLAGTLFHHLYDFVPDDDGIWKECSKDGHRRATLRAHLHAPTTAGVTHVLPANQPHGVTKPPGFAISLFEQREEGRAQPFTAWQRTDADAEALLKHGPVSARRVLAEARALLEEVAFRAEDTLARAVRPTVPS